MLSSFESMRNEVAVNAMGVDPDVKGLEPVEVAEQEDERSLPQVQALVTLGSEDAPACSDGICW